MKFVDTKKGNSDISFIQNFVHGAQGNQENEVQSKLFLKQLTKKAESKDVTSIFAQNCVDAFYARGYSSCR
jgi:hypothetical protein